MHAMMQQIHMNMNILKILVLFITCAAAIDTVKKCLD